jgi:hypothetical protein
VKKTMKGKNDFFFLKGKGFAATSLLKVVPYTSGKI